MASGGAIFRKAVKQKKIATSIQKVKLNVIFQTAKSAFFVKRLLTAFSTDCTLGRPENIPFIIFCDNQSAIAWVNDMGGHARTKYYNIELE